MINRKFWMLSLLLLLGLVLTPAVLATPPEEISGWFFWAPEPYSYCLFSAADNGQPDGFIEGCVIQTDTPGRASHGTFYQFPIFPEHEPDNVTGQCEYNLATFRIPGRPDDDGDPVGVLNRCSGSLEGLHLTITGEAYEFYWSGTYHYGP